MKAEETVIDNAEITITGKPKLQEAVLRGELRICVEPLLKRQAQISFEAGEQSGRDKGHREVVEWINKNCNDVITVSEMQGLDCWNEQLKEWGIE